MPTVVLACGGGNKQPEKPEPEAVVEVKKPTAPADTEEDRERKRRTEALSIVPEGTSCLPAALKNANAPRLELAAVGSEAIVCAIDQDRTRLLGPIACWSVEIRDSAHSGALTYQPPAPLPGKGFAAMVDDHCVRGYCLPKDAKVPADPVGFIAWSRDGKKVAVLAGDSVHLFDAEAKTHESSFSIRGDKGVTSEPTALQWNEDAVFVEASDGTTSPVYVFKLDGAPVGPIEALGGKDKTPLSTRNGAFVLLDQKRVGISEQGLTSLTIYEAANGKRTKLVRKLPATTCSKADIDAVWRDPSAGNAKCKDYVEKTFGHFVGADMLAGTKSLLAMLRGPRLGELAVIDPKTLAEKKIIKMPWCGNGAAAAEAK